MLVNAEIWCHTHRLGVSALGFPHPNQLHPHPETTTSFPHSSHCDFVLFLRTCFNKLICQATQKFIEPCETKLRKTVARKHTYIYKDGSQKLKRFEVAELWSARVSATMKHRTSGFIIKVGLYWKRSNVVHVGVFCICTIILLIPHITASWHASHVYELQLTSKPKQQRKTRVSPGVKKGGRYRRTTSSTSCFSQDTLRCLLNDTQTFNSTSGCVSVLGRETPCKLIPRIVCLSRRRGREETDMFFFSFWRQTGPNTEPSLLMITATSIYIEVSVRNNVDCRWLKMEKCGINTKR